MKPITCAFNEPYDTYSDFEHDLLGHLEEFGWRSTHVLADEDGSRSFTYTTGFWYSLRQPEVILFDFPAQLAHYVLGQIYNRVSDGATFPTGHSTPGILPGENVCFLDVRDDARDTYLLSSKWFYKGLGFPCVLMVWPDPQGNYPWHPDFQQNLIGSQYDLTENGWQDQSA